MTRASRQPLVAVSSDRVFDGHLRQLARVLSRRAMTADEIADAVKCVKATVYARIDRLPEIGYAVLRGKFPSRSKRGEAVFYAAKVPEGES